MTIGTSYSVAKRTLIDALTARPGLAGVTVAYDLPTRGQDIRGDTGSWERISFDEGVDPIPVEGSQANVVFCSLPLHLDETYLLPVVIQVVRPEANDTRAIDERVDELVGEVLEEVATDPTLGLLSFSRFEIPRAAATARWAGYIGEGRGRAAGCRLDLEVECRITFS
jgi:hypothetical protein